MSPRTGRPTENPKNIRIGVRLTQDEKEMLDEWGREFLAESRRRTDLIRFGRFQDAWWDKKRDADTHYELFPFSQTQLEQNEYLKQNPGW